MLLRIEDMVYIILDLQVLIFKKDVVVSSRSRDLYYGEGGSVIREARCSRGSVSYCVYSQYLLSTMWSLH